MKRKKEEDKKDKDAKDLPSQGIAKSEKYKNKL